MAFSQKGRSVRVKTPLGDDVLLLEAFTGREAVSQLFHFELDLLAPSTKAIAFDSLLGQSVTLCVEPWAGKPRFINGIVNRLTEGAQLCGSQGDSTFIRYHAELVPKLWLLTCRRQSRIFQQLTVPDILKKVLAGVDVSWQIQGSFEPRDYCVQYAETDLDFASRLMEEEGICYYFKHQDGSHTLVVSDQGSLCTAVPGDSSIVYETAEGGLREEGRVVAWQKSQAVRPGKVTLWDSCFELPGKNLEAKQAVPDSAQAGTVTHKLKLASSDQLELYDFPGDYAKRFDGIAPGGGDRAGDLQKIFQDSTRTAALRGQEQAATAVLIEGQSLCPQFTAGHKFTLKQHFNANGDYALVEVEHRATIKSVYTGAAEDELVYENRFHCIPATVPFRPARATPRPRIAGTQTAVVVGPSGEEIFTDKYGRVKVQFPWDREGKKDASSSCWIRVGTLWAGKQWGSIWIPRVGQEVIVAFEEGDPDRPIIVGSVYNAEQMPPNVLPDNRTQSGIRSRSTPQGAATASNELRFEDKKDEEDVYFHAQKDFHRVVENDDQLQVMHDQKIEIKNDRALTVQEGNETLAIQKGNQALKIDKGNQAINIDKGNQTITLGQGNRVVTLSQGNDTLAIKRGNLSVKLDMGKSSTEAMQGIELKVGQNSIVINQSGITLQGMTIKLEGQVQVQVQAPMAQVQADATLTLKGGVVMIN
jgi:type VI secretion system secreted protein VgrG